MSKKILSILLAAVLTISLLSSCAKKAEVKKETKNESADGTMVGNMYKTGVPIVKDSTTFTVMIKKSTLSKNNFNEKESTKYFEGKTNLKFDWLEVPAAGWDEKINITFASQDLPDAIIGGVSDSSFLNNLPSMTELSSLVDKWAPNTKKFFESRPEVLKSIKVPGGKIYALPGMDEGPWLNIAKHLWINKVWANKVGVKMPQTTDEFYQLLKAFKEKDPNGNGKQDEIPFSFAGAGDINSMFGSFGVLENSQHAMVKNGKVVFTPGEAGYYEALKYFNKLIKEGLIDPESFSQNGSQLTAKGRSPDYILGAFINGVDDNITGDPRCLDYEAVIPFKGPKGDQLANLDTVTPGITKNSLIITTKTKTPEILVRFYDYVNDSFENKMMWEMGPEGTSWRQLPGGKWEIKEDNVQKGSSWGEYRHTISAGAIHLSLIDKVVEGELRVLDGRTQRKYDIVKKSLPFTPKEILPDAYEDPKTSEERVMLATDIDNYIKNFSAKAMLNGITDKEWTDHLAQLKNLKVDQYVKLLQNYYDANK